MVHRVGPTPQISQPQGNAPEDVRGLARAFFLDSTDIRARLRDMLPKDGEERMEAPLPLMIFTTAGLPAAADWEGSVVFDTTTNRLAYSDGSSWLQVATTADLITQATGTFTPALAFGGSTTGVTYTTQTGNYSRIGNLVFIEINIVLTSNGSGTGAATIANLPFTSIARIQNMPVEYNAGVTGITNGASFARVSASSTSIALVHDTGGAGMQVTTETQINDTANFRINGVYRLA